MQMGKKQSKMRFLITDLGHEDLILGYPWLATFEPKFSWADGTIEVENLPVIVKSLNWETRLTKTTITRRDAKVRCGPVRRQKIPNPKPEPGLVLALMPNRKPLWGAVWFRCGSG